MKAVGYWSGAGEGVGTFTDTATAYETFMATATHCTMVDLHEVRLPHLGYGLLGAGVTGMVLRYCDKEYDVPFEGVTYAGGTHIVAGLADPVPRVQRKQIRTVLGTEVDSLDVSITLDGTEKLPSADGGGGTPRWTVRDAIRVGLFDGALWSLRRRFLTGPPTYPLTPTSIPTTLGAMVLFRGFVADATVSRAKASFTVKSYLEKLNIGVPRNVFQGPCLNTLGDAMCTVDFMTSPVGVPLAVNSTIASVVNATSLKLTAGDFPTTDYPLSYFRLGTLQFTTGVLAGLRRGVIAWQNVPVFGNLVEFTVPLPTPPTVGDGVRVTAGCEKTVAHCEFKFANFLNPSVPTEGLRFRGMPYVPAPDSAI